MNNQHLAPQALDTGQLKQQVRHFAETHEDAHDDGKNGDPQLK